MTLAINGEQKNFVGIGKLMVNTTSKPWNIPQLHFLVDRTADHFEATCLEFGNVAAGATHEESAKRLVTNLLEYIQAVMGEEGGKYEEFKELALNNFMADYWAAYRHIEFSLAEGKQDLSHEIEIRIIRAIQNMLDEKVKELIANKAKEAEAIREYEKLTAFKITAVSYASLEKAA